MTILNRQFSEFIDINTLRASLWYIRTSNSA